MADTIRTLASLNTQFADNIQGVISPQDIRDLFVSLMVHGEIGSGAKSAITLGTGFQALDCDVAGVVGRGLTIDTVNKWIAAIPVDLKAEVTLEVMFQGAANTTYDFAVFTNPDSAPVQLQRLTGSERILNATQVGKINMAASIALRGGDKLQAGVRSNGASFTLLRCALRVKRLAIE